MESDPISSFPMHVTYLKKGTKGRTRLSTIQKSTPPELAKAKTMEEVYIALFKMKMNMMSYEAFEDVNFVIDVPEYPTLDNSAVNVMVNIKEARPLRVGLQGSISSTGDDAGLEGTVDLVNPTGRADLLSGSVQYNALRNSVYYSIGYRIPNFLFGNHLMLNYSRDFRDFVKESSANSVSEGITLNFTNPGRWLSFGYSFMWRDLIPAGDIDVEKITNSHCSKSIVDECRPSIKSSIFATLTLDSRNAGVSSTSGSYFRLQSSLSGLLGDVHQWKNDVIANTSFQITPDILGEKGVAVHFSGYGGLIKNFGRRKTRYFDRFFLTGENIRGYEMKDIGPRSKPEEGGRPEGDVLGGDKCMALGAAISFPLIFKPNTPLGIRGHVFYNIGNIWNVGTNWKKAFNTSLSSYGVGLMIPFGMVGRLEINYAISRKRFNFLFCAI